MITKNKNKKPLMSMLRKMSIVPVALVAMYLFSCNNGLQSAENKEGAVRVKTDIVDKSVDTPAVSSSDVTNDEVMLFALVEVKPLFNGGDPENEFRKWVMNNTIYPAEAQKKGISGRVFVQFIIDTDGSVINATLLRGVDTLLDAESLRVIKSSPKWTPGKHEGKTVKVSYTFPFNFQLSN